MAKRPYFSRKRVNSFWIVKSGRRPNSSPTGC
jgi:hypothetical protein